MVINFSVQSGKPSGENSSTFVAWEVFRYQHVLPSSPHCLHLLHQLALCPQDVPLFLVGICNVRAFSDWQCSWKCLKFTVQGPLLLYFLYYYICLSPSSEIQCLSIPSRSSSLLTFKFTHFWWVKIARVLTTDRRAVSKARFLQCLFH